MTMGKYSGGKAWLAAVIVKKDGKPIDGLPSKGEHTIALKPGQTLQGDRSVVAAELQGVFKGCTFKWE